MTENTYVLGHGLAEIRRLELQAYMLETPTRRVMDGIGLREGMSVLDIGTGAGDVALLAAGYVGLTGRVVGIDRNPDVIERARARSAHLDQVSFELCAFDDAETLGSFDLVIGRYVACHQMDKVAFLRCAASLANPGGTVAFVEPAVDEKRVMSQPPAALFDDTYNWVVRAFEAGGVDHGLGNRCVSWFAQAGLGAPALVCETPIGDSRSYLIELTCLTLQSLAPLLEKIGLVKVEQLGLATLQARVQVAAAAAGSQVKCTPTVGAWTKVG